MKVTEIMSREVETVSANATLVEAARLMGEDDIGFLVVSDDRIRGVLTDRDIVIRAVAEGLVPGETRVREVMTADAFVVSQDDTVESAALLMQERRIRRLLVEDESGKCVGVVSLGDFAAAGHQCELSGKTLESVCISHH